MTARTTTSKSSFLLPLQARKFRVWWGGRVVGLAGEVTVNVTMPTLVLQMTGTLNSWATIVLLQSLARVLFVLFGGVLVDKSHPVRVMSIAALGQVLLAGALLSVSLSSNFFLWLFYLWAIGNGILSAVLTPAINTLIPALLEDEELLLAGNAFYMSSNQILQFIIPITSGYFVAHIGTWSAFLVATLAPLVFFIVLMTLPKNKSLQITSKNKNLLQPIKEGFKTVLADTVMRVLILSTGIRMFGAGLLMWIGLPSLSQLVFHGGTEGYGILVSVLAGGATLGSLCAGLLKRQHKQGRIQSYLTLGFGVSLLFLSQVSSLAAAIVFVILVGFTWSAGSVINTTLIQTRTTLENRGRVMSIVTLALIGTEPLAFALTGMIGDAIGARGVVIVCGIAVLAAGLLTTFSRPVQQTTLHAQNIS